MSQVKTVKVTMNIETGNVEELKRIMENHIEYVMDLENNRDIINYVYGVECKEER